MNGLDALVSSFLLQGNSLEAPWSFSILSMRLIAVFCKGVRVMTSLSFIECCRLFAIDPKTLRQWVAQAEMSLYPHPVDARIKCLSREQVEILARLHDRPHPFPETNPSTAEASDAVLLRTRLAQIEAQVATLQTQITDLTLQLLREREQHTEARLLALEAEPGEHALTVMGQMVLPAFPRHATEKRLIPLIEYGARSRYVLITPEEGELSILPDSPEWFEWLASLSSFRFVGHSGRFSARRGFNQRPNRSWYAHRTVHQQSRCKYIGVSEHVTIARLEYIAAELQLPATMR